MGLRIKIDGQNYESFNEFNLNLKYNSVASIFSVTGVYDQMNESQKRLFKPFSYHNVDVFYDNVKLITGTSLNTSTKESNKKTVASLSGYSKPGILEDCQIPLTNYPLQFDNLSLKEITERLIQPFGLRLIIDSTVAILAAKLYETTTAESGQTIKDYLSDLASQRGLILSHDRNGNLLLTKPKVNLKSIATYREGVPTTNISLSVRGQSLHSQISVLRQSSFDTDVAGEEIINNNLVNIFRPSVKEQSSGQNDQTLNFAKTIRGSELRAVSLTIESDRWKWYDGQKNHLITPNNIIDVISPNNFIPNRTSFFVEEVDIKGTPEGEKAIIKAVMPECYNLNNPVNFIG